MKNRLTDYDTIIFCCVFGNYKHALKEKGITPEQAEQIKKSAEYREWVVQEETINQNKKCQL